MEIDNLNRIDILYGNTGIPSYFFSSEKSEMDMKISLKDYEDGSVLELTNDSENNEYIFVETTKEGLNGIMVSVKIEDLKLALRKFSTK